MPCGRVASPHVFSMSAEKVEGGTTSGAKEGGGGGAATQTWRRAEPSMRPKSVVLSALVARATGYSNCAAPPTPSPLPLAPLPASVVTAPVATSTRRIMWLR